MSDTKLREKADALIAFTQQGPRFIAWVQAVTDALAPATEKAKPGLKDSLWALLSSLRLWKSKGELAMHPSRLDGMIAAVLEDYGGVFIDAPAPEKAAKVETGTVPCPNCGVLGLDEYDHRKLDQFGTAFDKGGGFTCQPAPPEPAAPEMPGRKGWSDDPSWIVDCAATELRRLAALSREGIRNTSEDWPETCASRLENLWRNLAQPVVVGMTEELEHVLSIAERDLRYKEECFDDSARTVPDERIERLRAAIAAVREQFGNGRKVECPNCGEMTEHNHSRYEGPGPDKWACQPAPPEPAAICSPEWDKRVHSSAAKIALATAGMTTPPEPAAPSWMKVSCLGDVDAGKEDLLCPPPDPKSCWICRQHEEHCCPQPELTAREMPEAVKWAIYQLRQNVRLWEIHGEQPASETDRKTADALESWWRNLAQPVAVGMTEELRMILDVAESRAEDQRHDGLLECSRNLERAIAAVRQQAAQGRKVELGKVRELVNDLKRALSEAAPSEMTMLDPHEWRSDLAAVFAELDAAEGKRRE